MSGNIIFDNSIGVGVKKIAQNHSGVIILLEDGTIEQHSSYGPTYRVPPDLLGHRIVDIWSRPTAAVRSMSSSRTAAS